MIRLLDESWQDARLAVRALSAAPVVAVVMVLSLALGIGASSAIFSVINGVLLRSLPVSDPARLVLVTDDAARVRAWSFPVWREVQRHPALFSQSGAWSFTRFDLASGGEAQPVDGMWASASLFDTLGVPAALGRTLVESDDRPGGGSGGPAVVISHAFWRQRFGPAGDVIGRTLTLDTVPFTIVGVMPPGFSGPEVGRAFDVIVPLAAEPLVRGVDSFVDQSGATFLTIIARLRADQTLDSATAGLRHAQAEIRRATLGEIGRFGSQASIDRYLAAPFVLASGATGYSGARDLRGQYRRALLTILAVVGLLLLIACVNVANLLMARTVAREHELSVRLALGARPLRLVRQLFAETVVLYGGGALLGLAIAGWGSRALAGQLATPGDRIAIDLGIDARVVLFAMAVTAIVTLVFGTAPALAALRLSPAGSLAERRQVGMGRSGGRVEDWSIVVQVALSLMLVVAAGLFVRTFVALSRSDLGFQPRPVVVATIDGHRSHRAAADRLAAYERLRDAVRRSPDVADAALSLTTPLGEGQFTPPVEIEGVADTRGPVWGNLISPGWFGTLQTPIVAGRDLQDGDRAGAPRVALVNQAFARKFARGGNPIGRALTLYARTRMALGPIQIVGVVGDAVYGSLRSGAPAAFYLPLAQFDHLTELGIRTIRLSVRARSGSPERLARLIIASAAAEDPRLVLTFRPLADQIDASLARERLVAQLSAGFAALALLLAALGLYGAIAYRTARRRTEIAVRMALGAAPWRVIALVIGRVALLAGAGAAGGIALSLWTSRLVAGLVYGLEPRDPLTLAGAALVLFAVTAGAAWMPARRAARTDPGLVLRER